MTKPPRAEKRKAWNMTASELIANDNAIVRLNNSLTSLRFFKGDVEVERIYWRLRAPNGRIVADGAEGYESLAAAVKGFKSAAKLAAKALAQMEGE